MAHSPGPTTSAGSTPYSEESLVIPRYRNSQPDRHPDGDNHAQPKLSHAAAPLPYRAKHNPQRRRHTTRERLPPTQPRGPSTQPLMLSRKAGLANPTKSP